MKEFEYDDLQTQAPTPWQWDRAAIRLPNDQVATHTLNGPCRTYRLGKPMTIGELEAMPEDLQLTYLRKLRNAGGTQQSVGEMLGVLPARLSAWGVRFDRPNPAAWAAFLNQ